MDNKILEIFIPGPAGRLEAKYYKSKKNERWVVYKDNIEASKITNSEACAYTNGTSISMKNLFFNVPARRNFLKSKGVETKHIIDEFHRVALTHPEIHFTMHHNKNLIFDLPSSNTRQRIVSIFGKKYNERLVPVEEETSITKISGFVLKPEFSKRTRGEQFLFINNRFIRNNSINHAIKVVFNSNRSVTGVLLPEDKYSGVSK